MLRRMPVGPRKEASREVLAAGLAGFLHVNFRVSFSNSASFVLWPLYWDSNGFIDKFGRNRHLSNVDPSWSITELSQMYLFPFLSLGKGFNSLQLSHSLCVLLGVVCFQWASLVAQLVKNPPAGQETPV